METTNPLRVAFARNHPDELALLLARRGPDELLAALNGLPADAPAGVIARLPHHTAVRLLAEQPDEVVTDWLSHASVDDALTLVLHLAEERRERILAGLPNRSARRTLERLVIYPQQTVGALADPGVTRLTASTRLAEAIEMLRGDDPDDLQRVWIVDAEGRYVGLLDPNKALLAEAPDGIAVGELAVQVAPLRAETTLVAARGVEEWLNHPQLPVVDYLNHLLGALAQQRLVSALAGETQRQYGVFDGVSAMTESYFRVLGVCLSDLLGTRDSR